VGRIVDASGDGEFQEAGGDGGPRQVGADGRAEQLPDSLLGAAGTAFRPGGVALSWTA
jgi:hypothetical protein